MKKSENRYPEHHIEFPAALWASYFADRSIDNRNALVVHYLPMAERIAYRMARVVPQSVDPGDLLSSASATLMRAIELADPKRLSRFIAYAVRSIKGKLARVEGVQTRLPELMRGLARKLAEIEDQHYVSTGERLGWDELQALAKTTEATQHVLRQWGTVDSLDFIVPTSEETLGSIFVQKREIDPAVSVLAADIPDFNPEPRFEKCRVTFAKGNRSRCKNDLAGCYWVKVLRGKQYHLGSALEDPHGYDASARFAMIERRVKREQAA